jgi:hypothetical protein
MTSALSREVETPQSRGQSKRQLSMTSPSKSCREFATHHGLVFNDFFEPEFVLLDCALEAFHDHNAQVGVNSVRFRNEGHLTWRYITALYQRVHEQYSACAICYFTGAWASVEVLTRVVLESAANTVYVSQNPTQRLPRYLAHYFETEGKKVQRQQIYGRQLTTEEKGLVDEAIAIGTSGLSSRRKLLEQILRNDQLTIDGAEEWPASTFDLFRAIGWEAIYRDLYSTLSSQVHNDADSYVDYIIATAVSAIDSAGNLDAASEVRMHVLHYFHSACAALLKATESANAALGLHQTVVTKCKVELNPRLETNASKLLALKRRNLLPHQI